MPHGGDIRGLSNSKLKLCGDTFRFEDGSIPRIVFRDHEIAIGCKTISREALDELQRRYQEFLTDKREQVIQ